MVDFANVKDTASCVTPTPPMSTLEFLHLGMVDLANLFYTLRTPTSTLHLVHLCMVGFEKFQSHLKFVTPMSTLGFLYLCVADFANFKDSVSL